MSTPRWPAPTSHGAQLADPATELWAPLARLQFETLSKCTAMIGRRVVNELRSSLRQRLKLPDVPIVLTGHQPELYHPGVWVKNFAAAKAAKNCDGFALNLIADHDTLKSRTVQIVHPDEVPQRVTTEALPFDQHSPELPWELAEVIDPSLWTQFVQRVCVLSKSWCFTPILVKRDWPKPQGRWTHVLTKMRRTIEAELGLNIRDLPVSELSKTPEFGEFVQVIQKELPRFQEIYNQAILAYRVRHKLRSRTHPAPELTENELPFWSVTELGRTIPASDTPLSAYRPRALTLTLFARLLLGDVFVHGLGGAKYDEVTDDVIRNWLKIEPPRYAVLSATALLPFKRFPADYQELRKIQRDLRELDWQPERHGAGPAELVQQKKHWIATATMNRQARLRRFQELNQITRQLRHGLDRSVMETKEIRFRQGISANQKLASRDFSWILHPEETLLPFLRSYLE